MISRSGGAATLRSVDDSAVLTARLPTRVYSFQDSETVDVFMTDLPASVWSGGADVSEMSGIMVQLHMFIRPKAGSTPIADTATTATIRCLVLARGELGLYGGGGFFVNGDKPGEAKFRGGIRDATMRLLSATGGFEDRLGSCLFSGEVSGSHDEATAEQMRRAMRALIGETAPIEQN